MNEENEMQISLRSFVYTMMRQLIVEDANYLENELKDLVNFVNFSTTLQIDISSSFCTLGKKFVLINREVRASKALKLYEKMSLIFPRYLR